MGDKKGKSSHSSLPYPQPRSRSAFQACGGSPVPFVQNTNECAEETRRCFQLRAAFNSPQRVQFPQLIFKDSTLSWSTELLLQVYGVRQRLPGVHGGWIYLPPQVLLAFWQDPALAIVTLCMSPISPFCGIYSVSTSPSASIWPAVRILSPSLQC